MLKDFPIADFSVFTAPIEKLVALNVSKFEAATEAQTAAIKELVSLTEARTKAMTEIKDFDGLTAYMKEQNELAQSSVATAINDGKTAVEDAKTYAEEVQKIMSEGFEATTKAAKKAAKKVA